MERIRRGWFGADPKPDVELPPVGPGFVSMDDAARYAHEQIGSQRDVEYGGVILQSLADELFYATDPVEGGENYFDMTTVLNRDSNRQYVHPEGYRCVAEYHSHPDLFDRYKANHPDFSDRRIKALNSFYSEEDLVANILEPAFFTASYLSGPEGSLFKHVCTRSEAERRFGVWLETKQPFGRPDGYDGVVENLFRKVASVSQLSIVVSNAVWGGSTGEVPENWKPYSPFVPKQRELPPCGPVQASLTDAINHAQARLAARPQSIQQVYVLKHDDKHLYAVTEPSGSAGGQQSVQAIFPTGPDGKHQLPAHFHLSAVYLGKGGNGAVATTRQPWLYRNFFWPPELARHLYQGRLAPELLKQGVYSIFLGAEDGALLRYTCSFSATEAQLYRVESNGAVVDNDIDAALVAGRLKPSEFVLRLVAAGQLDVLKTSNVGKGNKVWSKTGSVGTDWRPFAEIPLPMYSPPFVSADDAARWAHVMIGQRRDVEYGGVILKRGNRYYATHPIPDRRHTFDHKLLLAKDGEGRFIAPDDYSAEGFYHSHPADAVQIRTNFPGFTADQVTLFNNFFSEADQLFSIENRAFAKVHYFSGPDEVLLKYVSSGSADEKKVEQHLRGGPGETSSDFEFPVRRLAQAGELWVLIANRVWGGVRGRVTQAWRLGSPVALPGDIEQQPFCSEMLPRPELAVKRALELSGAADRPGAYGFVLKHTRDDAYVATFAASKGVSLFSPDAVFPKRGGKLRLPSNYRLEAIYFTGWYETHEVAARETWLANTFFTPAQVVAATRQARATRSIQDAARGLSLYMLATDSALLTFKIPEATRTSELVQESATGELHDNGAQAALLDGTLTPRDYARRIIDASVLSVVQGGGLWRTEGPVDARADLLASRHQVALSRSFLSARDAVTYAHEQIGNRRDRAYGGYVLKGIDGRFVVTEPMESLAEPFAFSLFFPVGNLGPLIPPEPYLLQGRYGSHAELSMVDPAPIVRRGWTRNDALVHQQMFSCDEMYSIIRAKPVAWLSASASCLLEYTPGNSSHEQLLLDNIAPQAGLNSLQSRLDRGEVKPVQWVWRVAEAGDLKIIQGNSFWGPRGSVFNDWTFNFGYAPRFGPPDFTIHGALFDSADEAARNLHGRVHGRNLAQAACFAFILKHQDEEQYIASEVVGVGANNVLFNLNSLFKPREAGGFEFPEGFVLHGLFRSQQWARRGLDRFNAWLTLFFVTPQVLYSALFEAQRGRTKSLPLYFSTLDGALLSYAPLPIDVKGGGEADNLLIRASAQLSSGLMRPRKFVQDWALRGALRVIRTSQCWDRTGLVDTMWRGYATMTPRRMGPAFASADGAARYVATRIGSGLRRAYGGVILRLPNGLFAATEPLALPPQGLTTEWIYPEPVMAAGLYPGGSTMVARYRSVVDQEVPLLLSATQKSIYKSMIPSAALATLLHIETQIRREYVFGLAGSILSYQASGSTEEQLLKQRLAPLNRAQGDYADNRVEQQLRDGALSPQDFVNQVAGAGEFCVVQGDALWGAARRVTVKFIANVPRVPDQEIRAVLFDSPCGPVFTRALDAVRYAQRHSRPQADVAFGYLLKAVNKPLYMTTLSLVREDFTDFEQVFVEGQLPQGYVIDGLYLVGSNVAIAPATDEMALSFFPPQHLAKALNFVSHARNRRVLPLYLLCADGALLTYTLSRDASLYSWTSHAHLDLPHLLEGSLKVLDYVRRLAVDGSLYIRVTSEVWSRNELVRTQWQPKKTPHSFSENPHFHSFCGPLYVYPDDAARYAQGLVPRFEEKQYLGAVLMPQDTQGYVALDPVEERAGTPGNNTLELLFWKGRAGFDVPADNELSTYSIAAVQAFFKAIDSTSSFAPLDKRLLNNFVAKDDLRNYLEVIKDNAPHAQSCYLACRGGALLKYVPAFTPAETRLLGPGSAPDPSVLVDQLRSHGTLTVLYPDAFWARRGVLGEGWMGARAEPEESWYGHDEL
ncbi:hypothetical protein C4J98_0578 [Pseudomonas orientalis]|uniref:DUF4329 domain-containing protein n=1 Tax=Pseudomonas orientalis TaxID=76758 RepID=UPI000F5799A1|nr:DUF4329 domain-containing protein [Pseudomonas orientalis]AZE82019.1 hypothetical protein C4J98_0578 [Pseudomonas orientalis]